MGHQAAPGALRPRGSPLPASLPGRDIEHGQRVGPGENAAEGLEAGPRLAQRIGHVFGVGVGEPRLAAGNEGIEIDEGEIAQPRRESFVGIDHGFFSPVPSGLAASAFCLAALSAAIFSFSAASGSLLGSLSPAAS